MQNPKTNFKVVLRLLTNLDLDYQAVKRLKEWRIKNKFAYPGEYKITHKSVKKWLKEYVLDIDHRFLFWVIVNNEFIGHIGIRNLKRKSVEIDNVSRGVGKYKGVMHEALSILLNTYSDRKIWLSVLPDNVHAIEFYKRNGFKEKGKSGKFMIMAYER